MLLSYCPPLTSKRVKDSVTKTGHSCEGVPMTTKLSRRKCQKAEQLQSDGKLKLTLGKKGPRAGDGLGGGALA